MKIIIEGSAEEMPDLIKEVQNQVVGKRPQDVKYISEKDLRKAVEYLSDYFKKYSKMTIFGNMPDVELSVFIEKILSK